MSHTDNIQSILFPNKKFTLKRMKDWLHKHDFRQDDIDKKTDFTHFR